MVGVYRYNLHKKSKGARSQWLCNKRRSAGCEPVYTVSKYGKPVIQIGSYRYNRRSTCKAARAQWLCSKWSVGCRASLITLKDEIVNIKNEHNH
ncbi:unnamed protein product [Euphydryas editha]|uniref:FLYWCH-type domain-containing protein n=1 Tax=Euphydryas editha TaxID=104508 RepID=A0AAU9TJW2_EUPED|nr:unnamed protein product [Euphydryas editha]